MKLFLTVFKMVWSDCLRCNLGNVGNLDADVVVFNFLMMMQLQRVVNVLLWLQVAKRQCGSKPCRVFVTPAQQSQHKEIC